MRSKRSVCLMKSGYLGWSTLIGRRKFKARELNRRRAKPTPPALFMLLVASATLLAAVQPVRVKLGEKWKISPLLLHFLQKEEELEERAGLFFFFKYQGCILFFSLDSCTHISISCKECWIEDDEKFIFVVYVILCYQDEDLLYLLIIIHRGI